MKKQFKLVICCFLTLLFVLQITIVSFAESPELNTSGPNFQISSKSAKRGDIVDVSVNINNNPGFWSIKVSLTYDDGLSFVKENGEPVVNTSSAFLSKGSVVTNYSSSVLSYLFVADSDTENVKLNGELFSFKIKVDDDAVKGNYKLSFTDYSSSNFINVDAEKVAFTFGDAEIAVDGKNTTLPSTVVPDDDDDYKSVDVDVYTMDENSRPTVFGVTRDLPNTKEFKNVSGNYVLSFARTTDESSLVSHSAYFKLPNDIFKKYSKYATLSFVLKTDSGNFYSHNNGYNRIYMSSFPTENPTSLNAVKIAENSTYVINSSGTKLEVDLTSSNGKCIVDNDYTYVNIINSVDNNNGNSYNYLYIDDVKLTYKEPIAANTVKIDGNVVANVETNGKYILPNNDDNIVAYRDKNNNIYRCGDNVVITENTEFTSVKLSLITKSTASMRLNDKEAANKISGIRFYTEINTAVIKELRNAGIDVQLGTLIAPKKYFENVDSNALKFGADFGKTVNYIDVKYTSEEYYKEDNFEGVVGSITQVKDNHALWNFVGRGYATVSVSGEQTKTVYATGEINLPEKSIGYLAYRIKEDTSYYNNLNANKKYLVDYYYAIYALTDPFCEDEF